MSLRPHVKTHKSIRFARQQIARGRTGITAAKPGEPMVFIEAGIQAITVAYPLINPDIVHTLLAAALKHGSKLRLIADCPETIAVAAEASRAVDQRTEVQLKVDVGLHRCGVDPFSETAVETARAIAENPYLSFAGLLSHAGHAYASTGAEQVRQIAGEERAIMTQMKARLEDAGLEVPHISVGSTPTDLLNDGFEGITEIRPGNYIFMDRTQMSLGAAMRPDVALTVITSVVSRNQQYAIIDAGSKVLSSDRGAHGSDHMQSFGLAARLNHPSGEPYIISHLSEEHGFIAHQGRHLDIGEKLQIIPNHACPVVNLADRIVLQQPSCHHRTEAVDARGRSI